MTTKISGKTTKTLNIAHRGARAYAPENTLVAFAKAKTLGCDMFEMDVRMTKDGVVIVHHDENLIRCTDAETKLPDRDNYNVIDFTYAELGLLDAGSWYVEQLALPSPERQLFLQSLTDAELAEFVTPSQRRFYASGGIKIPTLADTLCLAKELDLMVNIELKAQLDGGLMLVPAVVKTVLSMNLQDQILISSFEHDMLKQVRRQTRKIATAVLAGTPLKAPLTYLRQHKVAAYNLCCDENYNPDSSNELPGNHYLAHIDKVRKAGFDVNIWTCNDPQEMGYLLAAGVTGLISDYPNRVREKLEETAQTLVPSGRGLG
jgi:glycerophosphoryl diester phosphodiesterase